jgi:hypothetical protein
MTATRNGLSADLGECGGHVWAPADEQGADPIDRGKPEGPDRHIGNHKPPA